MRFAFVCCGGCRRNGALDFSDFELPLVTHTPPHQVRHAPTYICEDTRILYRHHDTIGVCLSFTIGLIAVRSSSDRVVSLQNSSFRPPCVGCPVSGCTAYSL